MDADGSPSPHDPRRCARVATVAGCAFALALLLAGCAATPGVETTSISRQLEAGSTQVKTAEQRFELQKVRHLATELPICLAYRMPAKGPALNAAFESTWSAIVATSGGGKLPVGQAHILHARFAKDMAGSFPAATTTELAQRLKRSYPGTEAEYLPIDRHAFKAQAVCGGRDTVFVDVERITFYRQEMPSDLAWSGEIHLGDVLFIRLDKSVRPEVAVKTE
ncbi:MAG: hypothetical protein ACT4N2_12415 [Hyphomicrobium sp.]